MAKPTKRSNDELVEDFYGINPSTFEVEQVSLTRGGVLSKFAKDGALFRHPIAPGRQALAEVIIVFHLTDIFSIHTQFENVDGTKKRIAELETKAAKMKAEAVERDKEKG